MNPNKYIRLGIVTALETATGWPVFDKNVPPDIDPQPTEYILVNSTTKGRFGDSKCGHEWLCSTQLDIISIQEKGYVSSEVVDDTEEAVLDVMPALQIPGFRTKFTRLLDSRSMDVELPAQTNVRTVMVFEQWLGKSETLIVT